MADDGSNKEAGGRRTEMKNEDVLVSVIIPAYNCAATICQAVDSALLQDVPLEILVLNDRSPDNLDQVMERYRGVPRVRYLHNEKNMGAAATRNHGVTVARGEYVAFLDADDWWAEGKLKAQMETIRSSRTVLCCTARELATPEGKLTGRIIPVREQITYRSLLLHNSINCSSAVLLREVALEFPMAHEDAHEDYITWLGILKKYGQASAVNEPFLKYRLTSTGKSGSKLKSARMTYRTYLYAGFGRVRALCLFAAYAVNGVVKYARAFLRI